MTKNVEIERKFLVTDRTIIDNVDGDTFKQGYLSVTPERTVRVRRAGDVGWLTVKSKPIGFTRREFEYQIPVEDAEDMLDNLCIGTVIAKIRHKLLHRGHTWEIDRYLTPHEGLIVAEVELDDEQEEVCLPSWLGIEVTNDHRFSNSYLSTHPNDTPAVADLKDDGRNPQLEPK